MKILPECLLPPPPEVLTAVSALSLAVDFHNAGRKSDAEALFFASNNDQVRSWVESLWGKNSVSSKRLVAISGSKPKPASGTRPRMPNTGEKRELIARDGYVCRFCGIPLVSADIRKRISIAYPEAVPWGSRNQEQHAAFQATWLQFDHIEPFSSGGESGLDNVVLTCAPCNYGRGDYLLEQVGLEDPRMRSPIKLNWDGLTRFA